MAEGLGAWPVAREHQDVEPVLIAWAPASQDPRPRHALHRPALLRADGLLPGATPIGASGLDLDEGDQVAAPHDQVEIVPAHPKAMGLHPPALTDEPVASGDLGLPAIAVAGIGPVGRWNVGGGHARMIAGEQCGGGIRLTQGRAEKRGATSGGLYVLVKLVQSDQDIARLRPVGRPENLRVMQLVNDARRAAVAHAEPTLQ
jgi:hypothetical protein